MEVSNSEHLQEQLFAIWTAKHRQFGITATEADIALLGLKMYRTCLTNPIEFLIIDMNLKTCYQ